MSGLKVNFNKIMLAGVNIVDSWLSAAATALHCKVGKLYFLYMGLCVGDGLRRLGFWEPMVARIRNRETRNTYWISWSTICSHKVAARGIITPETYFCVIGCGNIEST
jgi:hypothetical protein